MAARRAKQFHRPVGDQEESLCSAGATALVQPTPVATRGCGDVADSRLEDLEGTFAMRLERMFRLQT